MVKALGDSRTRTRKARARIVDGIEYEIPQGGERNVKLGKVLVSTGGLVASG